MSTSTQSRLRRLRRAPVAAALVAVAGMTVGFVVAPAAHAAPITPPSASAIYGDASPTYDGVYRQSLAILGLHAAGVTPAPAAVQWLLDQRCSNGVFTSFNPNPNPSKPCPVYNGNSYTGGIDSNATAVAAQALIAVGKTTEGTTAATFLQGAQNATDFGWEYTLGNNYGSDPNSSALVLMALDAAGLTPTHDPAPYFASLQFGQGQTTAVDANKGAFAFYDTGLPNIYATMQSIPGIGGSNLVNPPAPSTWANDATVFASAPTPTAANLADWGSTWLASKVDADAVSDGDLAWSVLSFATTATAKDEALAAYTKLRNGTLDLSTSDAAPSALGQAALAAKALGNAADATKFATLIARTLTTPPSATYKLSSNSVWSTQSVTLSRTALTGDASTITQSVSWGDGTKSTGLAAASTRLTHVYTSSTTATRAVTVTLTNAVSDGSTLAAGSVKVTKDTIHPRSALTAPSSTAKVSAWVSLRGTSTDVGLGVKVITVRLIEKRRGSWYSYNGSAWSKQLTYNLAQAKAKRIGVTPTASGAWTLRVKKLTKGTLKVKYSATDKAGNASTVTTTVATLTK